MRHPPLESCAAFDVVISFDNSLPHLLKDTDLVDAFRACRGQLRAGGVFLGSARDYSTAERTPNTTHPYGLRIRDGLTYRLRQDWQWVDADHYDATMVIEQQTANDWIETTRSTMRYYAVTLDRLLSLMMEAGFERVRIDTTSFYQPVLIGR